MCCAPKNAAHLEGPGVCLSFNIRLQYIKMEHQSWERSGLAIQQQWNNLPLVGVSSLGDASYPGDL